MATVLVGDPLLVSRAFGIGEDFVGPPHRVVVPPDFSPDVMRTGLAQADVLLTAHDMVTAETMDAAPQLKLIAKPGIGVDNIDVEAATARGIMVANAQGTRSQAVAEHALMLALAAARQMTAGRSATDPIVALELGGKTLGVLGFGEAGSRVATMGAALGMRVVSTTRTPPATTSVPVDFVALDDLFARSDVLVVCAPLTPETNGLVDERRLRAMPPGGVLVNVARGAVVRTPDLVRVLESGHLAAAGLDVTDPEPLPSDHALRRMPNVVLTPHVAGRTVQSQQRAIERLRTNVTAVLEGRTPPDVVNPAARQDPA